MHIDIYWLGGGRGSDTMDFMQSLDTCTTTVMYNTYAHQSGKSSCTHTHVHAGTAHTHTHTCTQLRTYTSHKLLLTLWTQHIEQYKKQLESIPPQRRYSLNINPYNTIKTQSLSFCKGLWSIECSLQCLVGRQLISSRSANFLPVLAPLYPM